MLESVLFAQLTSDVDVSLIIGTKMYPYVLPQTALLPALTYSRVSSPRIRGFNSNKGAAARIQINCWGSTYQSTKSLRSAVITRMESLQGAYDDITIQSIYLDNEIDDYNPETITYSAVLDFIVWYEGL